MTKKNIPRVLSRSDEEIEADRKEMKEYRRDRFKVVCEPTKDSFAGSNDDEYLLRVTHNGYHWNTMSVLITEIDAIIESLEMARRHYKRRKK